MSPLAQRAVSIVIQFVTLTLARLAADGFANMASRAQRADAFQTAIQHAITTLNLSDAQLGQLRAFIQWAGPLMQAGAPLMGGLVHLPRNALPPALRPFTDELNTMFDVFIMQTASNMGNRLTNDVLNNTATGVSQEIQNRNPDPNPTNPGGPVPPTTNPAGAAAAPTVAPRRMPDLGTFLAFYGITCPISTRRARNVFRRVELSIDHDFAGEQTHARWKLEGLNAWLGTHPEGFFRACGVPYPPSVTTDQQRAAFDIEIEDLVLASCRTYATDPSRTAQLGDLFDRMYNSEEQAAAIAQVKQILGIGVKLSVGFVATYLVTLALSFGTFAFGFPYGVYVALHGLFIAPLLPGGDYLWNQIGMGVVVLIVASIALILFGKMLTAGLLTADVVFSSATGPFRALGNAVSNGLREWGISTEPPAPNPPAAG